MIRHRTSRRAILAQGILALAVSSARADQPFQANQKAPSTEEMILQSLRDNPVTGPYQFAVRPVGKQFALSGRVGSLQVHDVAIRSLIARGYAVRDDLTIDTREADRVAAQAGYTPPIGFNYLYPPPLFGRVDDPFLGFEPPAVSYPPYWGAVANRPNVKLPTVDTAGPGPSTVQLTLDSQGVAYLSGQVASQAEKDMVAAKVSSVRGIGGVVNELEIIGNRPLPLDVPPPPPVPAFPPPQGVPPRPMAAPVPRPEVSDDGAPIPLNGDPLTRRVGEALGRRPALARLPVKVSGKDGVVTLSGKVPSAYEAMLVFRAVEQTPGVRDVVDRLEFAMPDEEERNPLRLKGRPEDVEPYLIAQVRRQLGDLAHVDRVRLHGNSVEIVGTVAVAEDTARVEATLRSIPLLRGFKLEPTFRSE